MLLTSGLPLGRLLRAVGGATVPCACPVRGSTTRCAVPAAGIWTVGRYGDDVRMCDAVVVRCVWFESLTVRRTAQTATAMVTPAVARMVPIVGRWVPGLIFRVDMVCSLVAAGVRGAPAG